ncbi:uncharacterized protein LOC109847485 [Asparagus officinalis]|uniref:uncharacterized protein LOC109847485 n=1 Tax=Asparagus officinalis TaxID=4686 RepID=UPI00098E5CC6|nr:uncharacterized protein LOC109847485 [Asparagus officinalis]
MDRYQRVEKPREEAPVNENEIRITALGRMRSYITYAASLLQEKGSGEIVFKAMGRAINKTVMIVELIKRRIVGLHQITAIGSTDITDTWEPLEEGLLPLETTRHVSMITITLSKTELDKNSVGYQTPLPADQVKPWGEFDHGGDALPSGRGRGRGGRGRGRGRGLGSICNHRSTQGALNHNWAIGGPGVKRGGGRAYRTGSQLESWIMVDGPKAGGRGRGFRGRGRWSFMVNQPDYQQDAGGYNDEEAPVLMQGGDNGVVDKDDIFCKIFAKEFGFSFYVVTPMILACRSRGRGQNRGRGRNGRPNGPIHEGNGGA